MAFLSATTVRFQPLSSSLHNITQIAMSSESYDNEMSSKDNR
ncbi:Acyl carrier protein 1 chloroplastic [Bienertia sinuspersici]